MSETSKLYDLWIHDYVNDDLNSYLEVIASLIDTSVRYRVAGQCMKFKPNVYNWFREVGITIPCAMWVWDETLIEGSATIMVIKFLKEEDRLMFRLRWL